MKTVMIPASGGSEKGSVAVDIFTPDRRARASLLVLPGWKFSRTRWHRETDLLDYCRKYGYRAVFPDMKISVYESRYYNETRIRWGPTPGGEWIQEILLPVMQKEYGLFRQGKRNFLLGLSTGGRGVLLVSQRNPELFTGGAALSGDFNQADMPSDRLMAGVYGPYSLHRERWHRVDNPETWIESGHCPVPLYIGHGTADSVVPFSQSLSLYRTIKEECPDTKVRFHRAEGMGHDFTYWNSELEAVFHFFEKL